MENTTASEVPAIGSLVRRAGGSVPYRVIERWNTGCRVQATVAEVTALNSNRTRALLGSEKFVSLAISKATGRTLLIDGRWSAWEVL